MFIVVVGTFEWSSLRIIRKIPRADAFVLVLVSAVTVATDLAIAVVVGVIVSALVFAWNAAKRMKAKSYKNNQGSTIYEVHGPLFFGSVRSFSELFDPKNDSDDVILDFSHTRVADHSGVEAIHSIAQRYARYGKTVHLVHLSPDCQVILKDMGDSVEVNVSEDPHYHIATDRLA